MGGEAQAKLRKKFSPSTRTLTTDQKVGQEIKNSSGILCTRAPPPRSLVVHPFGIFYDMKPWRENFGRKSLWIGTYIITWHGNMAHIHLSPVCLPITNGLYRLLNSWRRAWQHSPQQPSVDAPLISLAGHPPCKHYAALFHWFLTYHLTAFHLLCVSLHPLCCKYIETDKCSAVCVIS